jgi:hypothetical protein
VLSVNKGNSVDIRFSEKSEKSKEKEATKKKG